MFTARQIVEWLAFALLRLAATCSVTAGIALFTASMAVLAAGAATGASVDWVQLVIWGSLGLAVVLLAAGSSALYLSRVSTTWLHDDVRSQAPAGSAGGRLVFLTLTLVAVPALMLVRLQPLAAFWRDLLALADELNFWQGLQGNLNDSGYVLMPIFAALTPPGIATVAGLASVAGSALLLALLAVRSTRIPRALLLCVILQGGLVMGSVVGAAVVDGLIPSVEQLVRSTPDPDGTEQARILTAVERYGTVVRGAGQTLAWSWGAVAIWVPLLVWSPLRRRTFAALPGRADPNDHAPDYSTRDDQARERAYLEAARQIDRPTSASRWF